MWKKVRGTRKWWRREWQPTPVFMPGKAHGQRSPKGYNPWGRKRVGHDLATKQQWSNINWKMCVCVCVCAQSCLILCGPMDYSLPGSSGHGIFQARLLEWVAISFSRESSWPRDGTYISSTGRQILYHYHHPGGCDRGTCFRDMLSNPDFSCVILGHLIYNFLGIMAVENFYW